MTCCLLTGSYLPKLVQFSLISSFLLSLLSFIISCVLFRVVSVDDPSLLVRPERLSVDEVVGGEVGVVPGPAAQAVRDGV